MRQSLWPTSQQPAVGVAAVIALIMIFFILVIRQVLIVLLIVLAPPAFAAYLLPNTEQWFTKWRKTFVELLMVFPIIGFVYGASTLVSNVVGKLHAGTDNEEQQVRELPAGTIGRCESTDCRGNPQRVDEGCRSWRKQAPGPGQVPARSRLVATAAAEAPRRASASAVGCFHKPLRKGQQKRRSPGQKTSLTWAFVGLIDLCSTNYPTGVDTENLHRIRGPHATFRSAGIDTLPDDTQISRDASTSRRKWTRLNDEARAQVVARYTAGETTTTLAAEFGVAKSTIIGILRSSNVVVRRQPMTPEQVSEAARLYESGLSLSQVAKALNVNQETMRVAIIKAGVVLREPTKAKTS